MNENRTGEMRQESVLPALVKRVQDFGPHQDFAAYSQVVSEPSECERERKAEKSGRSWLESLRLQRTEEQMMYLRWIRQDLVTRCDGVGEAEGDSQSRSMCTELCPSHSPLSLESSRCLYLAVFPSL